MNTNTFLAEFQEILQRDEALSLDDVLADIEEWDSLSMMATIAFFEKHFKIKVVFQELKKLKTIADLAALAKGAVA